GRRAAAVCAALRRRGDDARGHRLPLRAGPRRRRGRHHRLPADLRWHGAAGGAGEPREHPPAAERARGGGRADRGRSRRRGLPLPRGARRVPARPLRRPAPEPDHRRLTPPRTFPSATAQEASMNKLEPPTPAQEITPAEPVESIDDDQAGDMLPDLAPEQQAELEQRADAWVEQVAQLNPHSQEYTAQVNALGAVARRTFERTSQTSSRFMQQSLRESKEKGNAQESVAKSLSELRTTMEDLAPKDETFADKALGWLPGRNMAKRYFRSFESNQDQLDQVLGALSRGQEMLQKDNAELSVERRALWDDLASLKKASYLLSLLDDRAVRRAEQLRAEGKAAEADALERDVLFAVRQRRQDVATQIAVTVQAYLSMGLIEDNNTKLQQGVERARTTTVTALRTAVITAQALENQKIVLDQIDAVNRTTDNLISRTSQ